MTNRIVLIQTDTTGTSTNLLSPEAIAYLQMFTRTPFTVYINANNREVIVQEYTNGVRRFILNMISAQILEILDLIQRYSDAKFVADGASLSALRGVASNLYHTIPTASDYTNLITMYFQVFIAQTCLVYDSPKNPVTIETMQAFHNAGYTMSNLNDLGWQKYPILITLFYTGSSFSFLNSNLLSSINYSIYSRDFYPSLDLVLAPNIINFSIIFPTSTATSQINSYWNIISKDPRFNKTDSYAAAILPILLNANWDWLEQVHLISTTEVQNGIYFALYLPFNEIKIKSNIFNCYLPDGLLTNIAWIVSKGYADVYLRNNIQSLIDLNPNIKKVKITSDPIGSFQCLWDRGYRNFVLEMPSQDVQKIQRLDCEGLFICNRATDPKLRKAGSRFLFTLADDNTMIQTLIVSSNKNANGHAVCVLGQSNNIDINKFRRQLDVQEIKWVDNVSLAPSDTEILYSIGNDANYEMVLSYVETHRFQFPNLTDIRKYGSYVTADQVIRVRALGVISDYTTINFNSCQPFLESKYSQISRPLYLFNTVNFLDLANILWNIDVKTLYYGGYIIDV